jgi:hypothetical protein
MLVVDGMDEVVLIGTLEFECGDVDWKFTELSVQ